MKQTEIWAAIVRDSLAAAMTERPDEPCLGARFRQIISSVAQKHGLTFPPEDEPTLRLASLLERFPEIVRIRRRGAQDVLLAPVDKPHLLVESSTGPAPRIREDLFRAFILISDSPRWYDAEHDAIVWTEFGADRPQGAIAIPPATVEGEIAVRKLFADTVDRSARAEIESALGSSKPLTLFASVVRTRRLGFAWHVFRTKKLVERIRTWAQSSGIGWRDDWLTDEPSGLPYLTGEPRSSDDQQRRAELIPMLQALDERDLARISVPLDVVLKLLDRRG